MWGEVPGASVRGDVGGGGGGGEVPGASVRGDEGGAWCQCEG